MVLALGLVGTTTVAAMEVPGLDPAVAAAVKNLNDAKTTCNLAELNNIIADDFFLLHADGRAETKKQYVDSSAKCNFENIRLDIKTARMHGDVAIVSGDMPFKIKNGPSMSFLTIQVFVKRQGMWLFAWQHSTDLARNKAAQSPGKQ